MDLVPAVYSAYVVHVGWVGWGSDVHVDLHSHDAATSPDLLPQVHTCGSVIHAGRGGTVRYLVLICFNITNMYYYSSITP